MLPTPPLVAADECVRDVLGHSGTTLYLYRGTKAGLRPGTKVGAVSAGETFLG